MEGVGFKMMNGLIFGSGIGLLTVAAFGPELELVNGYSTIIYSLGMTLVLIETMRLFLQMRRLS